MNLPGSTFEALFQSYSAVLSLKTSQIGDRLRYIDEPSSGYIAGKTLNSA